MEASEAAKSNEEIKAARVLSQKCLNRRKRRLEQLTPEQLQAHELSAELQVCVKVTTNRQQHSVVYCIYMELIFFSSFWSNY
jgi:signal transduction histidine kinase